MIKKHDAGNAMVETNSYEIMYCTTV